MKKIILNEEELIKKGFRVIRLWENEINKMKLEDFKNKINQGVESFR